MAESDGFQKRGVVAVPRCYGAAEHCSSAAAVCCILWRGPWVSLCRHRPRPYVDTGYLVTSFMREVPYKNRVGTKHFFLGHAVNDR